MYDCNLLMSSFYRFDNDFIGYIGYIPMDESSEATPKT